jgi:hypothetical protein
MKTIRTHIQCSENNQDATRSLQELQTAEALSIKEMRVARGGHAKNPHHKSCIGQCIDYCTYTAQRKG